MSEYKKTRKRKHSKRKKKNPVSTTSILAAIVVLLVVVLMFQIRKFFSTDTEEAKEDSEQQEILPLNPLSSDSFGFNGQFKTYDDGSITAEIGMDVSSNNGWIDWSTAAEQVNFAIIRAGYRGYADGTMKKDEYLEYNLQAASDNEIGIGLYFFSQAVNADEAREEAKFVIQAIQGYEIDYPVYFDWEPINDETARTATISASELTECAKVFCQTIEASGYRAGIYFNLSQAFTQINLAELRDYEFWLADYADTPTFPYKITTWQYTNEAICSGLDGAVDLDLYFTENAG